MGEEIKKDAGKMLVNAIVSLLIFWLGFSLTGRRADSQELNKKIDTKAEKIEVAEQVHQLNQKIDTKVSKETFEMLLSTVSDIKTDTRYLRDKLDNMKK